MIFYSPDRKGEHPQKHLKSFAAVLYANGYAEFNAIFGTGQVTEDGCWAHVRFEFFDEHATKPSTITTEALYRIGALYGIEDTIRGKPYNERQRVRRDESQPRLDALKAWIEATLPKLSAKAEIAKAMRYTLTRWSALIRYIDDRTLEVDNNAAQIAIRGIALGLKNWLIVGLDVGG